MMTVGIDISKEWLDVGQGDRLKRGGIPARELL